MDSNVPGFQPQAQPQKQRSPLWRKRKTEITFEMCEETVLRGINRGVIGRCAKCPGDSLMVTPEMVHQSVGVAVRNVWQAIESEQVHYVETVNGELLVCLESLRAWMQGRRLPGIEASLP